LQASKAPNKDLSAREIAAAERFSEHLLFIQRQQRMFLSSLGIAHGRLLVLASVLSSFAAADDVPDQVWHSHLRLSFVFDRVVLISILQMLSLVPAAWCECAHAKLLLFMLSGSESSVGASQSMAGGNATALGQLEH